MDKNKGKFIVSGQGGSCPVEICCANPRGKARFKIASGDGESRTLMDCSTWS